MERPSYTQTASECLNKYSEAGAFEGKYQLYGHLHLRNSLSYILTRMTTQTIRSVIKCIMYLKQRFTDNLLTANTEFLLNKWTNFNKNGTQTERRILLTGNFRTIEAHFHSLYFV